MILENTDHQPQLPLRGLQIFAVTAKHLNMVHAAATLGMTQSAVSRSIKALEGLLGAPLFRRGPRGLALTEAGVLLAEYVERGFGELSAGVYRFVQPRERTTLRVTCPYSFAARVLAPRVNRFLRQYPWIDLRLDTHRYVAGLDQADVVIRLGDGSWKDGVVTRLTQEVMFPVCTPAHLARLTSRDPATMLSESLLLHYAERSFWSEWLRAARLPLSLARQGPRFSNTALALTAAEAGGGFVMAHRVLVMDALAVGQLVRPFEQSIVDGLSFYLVVAKEVQGRSTVAAFCNWMRAQIDQGDTVNQ